VPGAEAFGAGVLDSVGRFASDQYRQIQQDARDHADTVALTDYDNQLAQWEHQNLYDPQTGVLNTVKGKDAVGLSADYSEKFDEFSKEALGNLNTRQQDAAMRLATRRREGIVSTLDRHGSVEADRYANDTYDASIKTSIEAAAANATDPVRVNTELQRQQVVTDSFAQRQGWSPEVKAEKLAEYQSATHVGVIDNLLSQNKDQAASVYFDAVKGQITGDKLAAVQRAIEEGSLQGDAQRKADEISAKATSLGEAESMVKEISDPKLRDKVQSYVEHDQQIKNVQDREQHEQLSINAANLIDKGGIRAVPASTWSQLTVGERSSLELYAKRNLKADGDGESSAQLTQWYQLKQQADRDPEGFAKLNLITYLGKLGKSQFTNLADLQSAIRKGDKPKADDLNNDFRSVNEIVVDSLHTAGIDTSDKDNVALVARFHDAVSQQVKTFEHLNGDKKATKQDIDKIASDLISRVVMVPGGFWNGLLHPFVPNVTGKRLIGLTIDDVPRADKALIEKKLQRDGRAVTDDAVLQVYIADQAGKR
jgi:hypothetical protein